MSSGQSFRVGVLFLFLRAVSACLPAPGSGCCAANNCGNVPRCSPSSVGASHLSSYSHMGPPHPPPHYGSRNGYGHEDSEYGYSKDGYHGGNGGEYSSIYQSRYGGANSYSGGDGYSDPYPSGGSYRSPFPSSGYGTPPSYPAPPNSYGAPPPPPSGYPFSLSYAPAAPSYYSPYNQQSQQYPASIAMPSYVQQSLYGSVPMISPSSHGLYQPIPVSYNPAEGPIYGSSVDLSQPNGPFLMTLPDPPNYIGGEQHYGGYSNGAGGYGSGATSPPGGYSTGKLKTVATLVEKVKTDKKLQKTDKAL